jgi:hypothetical protein
MEKEENLYFFHTNHLGSSSYITNLEGKVTQHIEYFASGEQWLNQSNSSYNLKLKGQALKIYLKFKLIESLVVKALK